MDSLSLLFLFYIYVCIHAYTYFQLVTNCLISHKCKQKNIYCLQTAFTCQIIIVYKDLVFIFQKMEGSILILYSLRFNIDNVLEELFFFQFTRSFEILRLTLTLLETVQLIRFYCLFYNWLTDFKIISLKYFFRKM